MELLYFTKKEQRESKMKKMIIFRLFSLGLLLSIISIEAKQEQLTIINDTKEKVRVRYPRKTKKAAKKILLPGERFSYAQGKAFIYLPSRNGTYEITIPESRSVGSLKKITLKQIMEVAKQKEHTGPYNYYTEKGKIGDIKIFFETIIE